MEINIDCDGVILDTIKFAFNDMERLKINTNNQKEIGDYFRYICDWRTLINEGGIINDAFTKIKILLESNVFDVVRINTHISLDEEAFIKSYYFKLFIPEIEVITIPREIGKHKVVNPSGNILIDDSEKKVRDWIQHGGIGILFNQNVNRLICPDESGYPFYITNDLLDILKVKELEEKVHLNYI